MLQSQFHPISIAIIPVFCGWLCAHTCRMFDNTNHINFPGQESFQIWHKRLLPVLHDLIQPPCMPLFDVEIIAELLDENWAYRGKTIHKLEVETHIKSWCQPLLNVRVNQIAILWFCSSGTLGDGRRRLCWVGQSSQNQRIRLQKWIGKPWICVRAIQKKKTFWKLKVAMENGPFIIDGLPVENM